MTEWNFLKQIKGAQRAVRINIPKKKAHPKHRPTVFDLSGMAHASGLNTADATTVPVLHPVSETPADPFLHSKDIARLWLRRIRSSIRGLTIPLYSPKSVSTMPQKTCLHLSAPCHKHPAPTRRKFPAVLPSYNWSRIRKFRALVFKRFFKFAVKRPSHSDQNEVPTGQSREKVRSGPPESTREYP